MVEIRAKRSAVRRIARANPADSAEPSYTDMGVMVHGSGPARPPATARRRSSPADLPTANDGRRFPTAFRTTGVGPHPIRTTDPSRDISTQGPIREPIGTQSTIAVRASRSRRSVTAARRLPEPSRIHSVVEDPSCRYTISGSDTVSPFHPAAALPGPDSEPLGPTDPVWNSRRSERPGRGDDEPPASPTVASGGSGRTIARLPGVHPLTGLPSPPGILIPAAHNRPAVE